MRAISKAKLLACGIFKQEIERCLINTGFRATMELLPFQIEHDKLKQEQFEMKLELRKKKSNLKQSKPNWNGTVPTASHLKRDTWPMVQIEFCVGSTEPGFDSAESNQKRSWFIFNLSKRMAGTWSWPDTDCTLLLQFIFSFTGKAQKAHSAGRQISPADRKVCAKVKAAVEKAYELVPEA